MNVKLLEEAFYEFKISLAVRELKRDKALGSNGSIVAFWQARWEIVKEYIMRFFKDSYAKGRFVKRLNLLLWS